MADFFIDRLVKMVIAEQCKMLEKGEYSFEKIKMKRLALWKADMRAMFWNYPAIQVYDLVDEALKEASDEQYLEKKLSQKAEKAYKKYEKKKILIKDKAHETIDANLKITEVAKMFNINVKNGKAVCPFHDDKDPSLSLSDEKNLFHCFGCNASGDIVEFYRRLKEQKDGQKGSH